uniref:Transmembrane protein n=1 Tax=Panagrellus redivivus TaxID=6233 RepID=A0A7E4VP74_PANRE
MQRVKPTFVLVSPYKFRHSTWIEPLTKHFSLILAILMFAGVVTTYQYGYYPNYWIRHLPTLIFYSLVYLFGRNSTNKTFISVQIHISYLFSIINTWFWIVFCPTEFSAFYITLPLSLAEIYSLMFYVFLLEITHRRQYAKDLSTAKDVAELNERDFYHLLLYCLFPIVYGPVVKVLHYFATWYPYMWCLDTFWFDCSAFELGYYAFVFCFSILCITVLCCNYHGIDDDIFQNGNTRKRIQYDSDGRAWYCVVYPATKDELIDGWWDIFKVERKLTGWGFNVCKLFQWKRNNVKYVNVVTPALKV